MIKFIAVIFVSFFFTGVFAQNYRIGGEVCATALKLNDFLVNCEFDKAYDLSDGLLKKNPDEPLYYYLVLASIGLKTLDFDEICDKEKFNRIYEKGMAKVSEKLAFEPDNCDLQMIKGFLTSSNAAFLLVSKKYASGVREGTKSLDILKFAHSCNPENFDTEYYLGFYDYAQAELRRRLGPIGIFTGLPKNSAEGIKSLEKCVKYARFMNFAAKMVLVDIYVRENKLEKTRNLLPELLKKYPESRFLLWTKMRYEFAEKDEVSAINTAVSASKLYFRDNAFHNGVMVLEEARKMSSYRKFPYEIREKIVKLENEMDKTKISLSDLKTFNSLVKE
jgi:tetratricopeptide (TPR) repeat protein